MGVGCSSDEEKLANRTVAEEMKKSKEESVKVTKVLLLGPGSSGKSTVIKQMIKIYGTGFTDIHRMHFKQVIYHNVLDSMSLLLRYTDDKLLSDSETAAKHRFLQLTLRPSSTKTNTVSTTSPSSQSSSSSSPSSPKAASSSSTSSSSSSSASASASPTSLQNQVGKGDINISQELANDISCLWSSRAIRSAYDNGSKFHLEESCKSYFERISFISSAGYVPSDDDILLARAATSGINEHEFNIKGNHFKMMDVGGQRSERRKWIHCFEGVHALIYVTSLSEYDQHLIEDETQNRMIESIILFKGVVNLKWFQNSAIIVFLNKQDLFAAKLGRVPFNESFPEYRGDNSFDDVSEWIEHQFSVQNSDKNRRVYMHVTHATDTKSTEAVFNAVRPLIIKQVLKAMNLT